MAYRVTQTARRQIDEILAYSLREYGRAAGDRYDLLITTAFDVIDAQPAAFGSRPVPGKVDIRDYDLRHCRTRLPPDQRVSNPRHKIVYRLAEAGAVDILAVIGRSLPSSLGPER